MREKYQRAIDEFVRRAVERYKDRIDEIISANLLYEKREKADYDIYYEPGKEEAESMIEDAENFWRGLRGVEAKREGFLYRIL